MNGYRLQAGIVLIYMSKKVPLNIRPETNACRDMGDVGVIPIADATKKN
jgi:hypothetical protein